MSKIIDLANSKIRTRYAPSPTGYLHIGGARTALFNYLFAKHFEGDFILRIEDTDVARNVAGGEKSQLDNLFWLGIIPDEYPTKENPKYGFYRQSEKLKRYWDLAHKLIEQKKAYLAFDSPEELQQQKQEQEKQGIFSFRYDRNWLKISQQEKIKRFKNKQFSIRLALEKNKEYAWNDIVRGPIKVNSNDIGDWVIIKSDGYPTYNFAVVVDDHDMEITHVLRGEEHISNTPKQLAVYDAFDWDFPNFGHLTIITDQSGKKLSKRDKSLFQFIEDYKNEGYLPQAIFNFLALLGWTSQDAKELMTKEELITAFLPQRLSKSPSKFDNKKLEWFSKQYFKQLTNDQIKENIKITLQNPLQNWLDFAIDTYKASCATFKDLEIEINSFSTILEECQNEKDKQIYSQIDDNLLKTFTSFLDWNDFSVVMLEQAIEKTKQATNLNGKKLLLPIRIATTFKSSGPELAKVIWLLGKDLILKRLAKWL
ncbi:glutamate--tRNA ligase [Mycoplasma sp. 1654_15]|uniref:glutamate--tRNA ligase n=1 Tax=Mycoplasma sp. 1654_15 TaxID=2725994 RepID=UPI001449C89E|nr:glutamate--tRNA ligase [Mycoplasma sp. 1654_15]QJB71273.1 glutamate--tRNA ligase [Mycoplasma sp. 1654_15]